MRAFSLCQFLAVPFLTLALVGTVLAADMQTTPVENAQVDDFTAGKSAIDAKHWSEAVVRFDKVVAKNPKNADAYNYLGFANRWLGKYDDAFAAYGKALALDPNHRGALQYSGIAYVKTSQMAKARAQLTQLQALCANCAETTELAKAITAAQ